MQFLFPLFFNPFVKGWNFFLVPLCVCGSIAIDVFVLFMKLVVLYVDFKLDESYTPSKISIRAGNGFHNLKVISFDLGS